MKERLTIYLNKDLYNFVVEQAKENLRNMSSYIASLVKKEKERIENGS